MAIFLQFPNVGVHIFTTRVRSVVVHIICTSLLALKQWQDFSCWNNLPLSLPVETVPGAE